MSQLISLQGSLFFAERTAAGKPGRQWWAGNVPEAALELSAEKVTKTESFTGSRGTYGTLPGTKAGRLTGSFDEWLSKNLALGLYGSVLPVAEGTATAEPLPAGLVVGESFSLDHPYASDLVITDSTSGTPLTVAQSAYKKVGHNERTYEIATDLTAYVEPLLAAYSYEAHEGVEVFSEDPREIYVIFDGINTETGDGVMYDLYRVKFDPFANVGLIHAEYGSLGFGADILVDPLNFNANGRGGYYRMRRKVAT